MPTIVVEFIDIPSWSYWNKKINNAYPSSQRINANLIAIKSISHLLLRAASELLYQQTSRSIFIQYQLLWLLVFVVSSVVSLFRCCCCCCNYLHILLHYFHCVRCFLHIFFSRCLSRHFSSYFPLNSRFLQFMSLLLLLLLQLLLFP